MKKTIEQTGPLMSFERLEDAAKFVEEEAAKKKSHWGFSIVFTWASWHVYYDHELNNTISWLKDVIYYVEDQKNVPTKAREQFLREVDDG